MSYLHNVDYERFNGHHCITCCTVTRRLKCQHKIKHNHHSRNISALSTHTKTYNPPSKKLITPEQNRTSSWIRWNSDERDVSPVIQLVQAQVSKSVRMQIKKLPRRETVENRIVIFEIRPHIFTKMGVCNHGSECLWQGQKTYIFLIALAKKLCQEKGQIKFKRTIDTRKCI